MAHKVVVEGVGFAESEGGKVRGCEEFLNEAVKPEE